MSRGVKWYAKNNRWGLRGDYRFAVTQSRDDAPAFFGRDTRYAHRVYGAVIINMLCGNLHSSELSLLIVIAVVRTRANCLRAKS